MSVATPRTTAQRAPGRVGASSAPPLTSGPGAKKRILDTADRLFYEDGIRSVGIDRLIAESAVTKATFYKHYGSKDRLIAEYLSGRHRASVELAEEIRAANPAPADALRALLHAVSARIQEPGFRGCAFLNAAAEFSDEAHPIRVAVTEHRDWYTDLLVDLLRGAGHPMPGDAADDIVLAEDGAQMGAYAGDAIAASAALHRAADRVLADLPGA